MPTVLAGAVVARALDQAGRDQLAAVGDRVDRGGHLHRVDGDPLAEGGHWIDIDKKQLNFITDA